MFGCAFTSELVDPDNNYQVFEQIGDLSGNKFIVSYMYNRFPQLNCSEGVKVIARLRINYGAKESFCEIAKNLGFWPFISATNNLRQRKMKSLLEDVFEAFLGVTEKILDTKKRVGVGYGIVYDILTTIFNEIDISLRYEDLYDAKTRLKELFDMHESVIGSLVYKENKIDQITFSIAYRFHEKNYIKIGEGSAALKADAQKNAAISALTNLSKQGWNKPVPSIYQKFNKNETEKTKELLSVSIITKLWGNDINILQPTKEKNKHQSNYLSTPLSLYCRLRDINGVDSCMEMGADPNIKDSEGMYPIDLLFIGKTDEIVVEKIMKLILKKGVFNMSQHVFNSYFTNYRDKYFITIIDKLIFI
jgi:dsRNA-specific ribonuclease